MKTQAQHGISAGQGHRGRIFGGRAVAVGLAAFVALATPEARAQTAILSYDFNSLTTGALSGQGVWSTLSLQQTPNVVAGPSGSVDTTQVIGVGASASPEVQAALFSSGSLTSSSVVTLTFDLYVGNSSASELFGIGSSTVTGASFGIWAGAFAIRGQGYSSLVNAVNSAGTAIQATLNHWYTVQSVWNLATNTGTLSILDLTAGATVFTTLYFDAGQSVTTASLGLTNLATTNNPSNWTNVYLRTAYGGSTGYLDNLSVSVASVPEPRTWGLLFLGVACLGARTYGGRRRFSLSR